MKDIKEITDLSIEREISLSLPDFRYYHVGIKFDTQI